MRKLTGRQSVAILSILFAVLALLRLVFPALDHGDEYTDACALTAGANFAQRGFAACRFLPVFDISAGPSPAYTHVPPLPDILNGVWRAVFHTESLRFFRSISLVFSYLDLLCWYFFVAILTSSPAFGLLAGLFYATNTLFIFGMDSLHTMCYANTLLSAFLCGCAFLARPSRYKPLITVLLWVLYFLQSLTTYEYVIFTGLFLVLFKRLIISDKRALTKRDIGFLLTAPVAGFALHLLQNAWYFGSLSAAITDMKSIALQRMLNSSDSAVALNFLSWFNLVVLKNFSDVFLFDYMSLFLMAFIGVAGYHFTKGRSRQRAYTGSCVFAILLVCGFSWYIAFPSHSIAHAFVRFLARHLVFAASIGYATLIYILISLVRKLNPDSAVIKLFVGAVAAVIVLTGLLRSDLPLTPRAITFSADFANVEGALAKVRESSVPGDTIGVNYFRYPFIRAYTKLSTIPVFSADGLNSLDKLPEYFIFMPYSNDQAGTLFEVLNGKYDIMFRCRSGRFPAVFFKKKGGAG